MILWTVSVILGALHNYIYSETAAMFPKLSGGIAIYAHEAWKKYFSFVGPIAAFGYWIGWSVVLSATGIVVGFLIQAQFYTSSATSTGWNHTWHLPGSPIYFSFPIALTIVIIIVIWTFNVLGMRPAVWVGYVTGGLLMIPLAVMMFLPYITGDWHSSNLHNNIRCDVDSLGVQRLHARHRLAVRDVLVVLRHGVLRDLRARVPRHRSRHAQGPAGGGHLRRDHLRPAAAGRDGHVRRPEHHRSTTTWTRFMPDVHDILRNGHRGFAIILLCAGIVLAMNTATADGSRALYGISQDGMTIRWFGKLNRKTCPANAMTLDALLNIVLLLTYASDPIGALKILMFSNLGYVLCHVFAMSGFMLLRKDRPNWPRPIKVSRSGSRSAAAGAVRPAAAGLGRLNSGLAWGQHPQDAGARGHRRALIAAGLYVFRVVVAGQAKLALRLWAPTMPDDVPPDGARSSRPDLNESNLGRRRRRPRLSPRDDRCPVPRVGLATRPPCCSDRAGLGQQPLGQLALLVGRELLELVVERALVDADVPVVERLHPQQRGLADELAQHLVGRPHHPAGLAVAQVALELQRLLLEAGAAAAVQHLVDHVGDVLGGVELDLPQPGQVVAAGQVARLHLRLRAVGDRSRAWATPRRTSREALVSMIASPTASWIVG